LFTVETETEKGDGNKEMTSDIEEVRDGVEKL